MGVVNGRWRRKSGGIRATSNRKGPEETDAGPQSDAECPAGNDEASLCGHRYVGMHEYAGYKN